MTNREFIIKGEKINIITAPDGRRAPSPDSISKLMQLTMRYGDSLREDKESKEMAEYLKNGK